MAKHGDTSKSLDELRQDFIDALRRLDLPSLDPIGVAERLERDWLIPLNESWQGQPWHGLAETHTPAEQAAAYRAAAKKARVAIEALRGEFAMAVLCTSIERGTHESKVRNLKLMNGMDEAVSFILSQLPVLEEAAVLEKRRIRTGPKLGTKPNNMCARGLVHRLEHEGVPYSDAMGGAHVLGARWAWTYLGIKGNPAQDIRQVRDGKIPKHQPETRSTDKAHPFAGLGVGTQ